MSDSPDDPADESPGEPAPSDPPPGIVHGSFRVDHRTARLPKSVGAGEFANALMVAAGPLEFILDFVQRLGEPARVVSRVVMPPLVAKQFLQALEHNVGLYETQFGPIPAIPRPQQAAVSESSKEAANQPPPEGEQTATEPPTAPAPPGGVASGIAGAGIEPAPQPPGQMVRPIEDIYDELKLDEEMLAGHYANAVIVRHTPAEFAFEFIARFMPHSVVSSRVIVSAPNLPSLMGSLRQALGDFSRRQPPGQTGRGELPPPSDN